MYQTVTNSIKSGTIDCSADECQEWLFRLDQKQMNDIKLGIVDVIKI